MQETYIVADVHGLRDPVVGDATKSSRHAVDVHSTLAAFRVDVTSLALVVHGVTDKEDALHSVEVFAGQLRQGIGSGRGTLRVALEDKAGVRVR